MRVFGIRPKRRHLKKKAGRRTPTRAGGLFSYPRPMLRYLLIPVYAALLCPELQARPNDKERETIGYDNAIVYRQPNDTCIFSVDITIAFGTVRRQERLTVDFLLCGPQEKFSEPCTIFIDGNARSRQERRLQRKLGIPASPPDIEVRLKRKKPIFVTYTARIPDRHPWMDSIYNLIIRQCMSTKRQEKYRLPQLRIPIRYADTP